MNHLIPVRLAYAALFAVLAWAITMAALTPGAEHIAGFGVRVVATAAGVFIGFHSWSVSEKHLSTPVHVVTFPIKFPACFIVTLILTWVAIRLATTALSIALGGNPGQLGNPLGLLVSFVVALLLFPVIESYIFGTTQHWLIVPLLPVAVLYAALRRLHDHVSAHIPSLQELIERGHVAYADQRRGVVRGEDDAPVQTAAEARRQAERNL